MVGSIAMVDMRHIVATMLMVNLLPMGDPIPMGDPYL